MSSWSHFAFASIYARRSLLPAATISVVSSSAVLVTRGRLGPAREVIGRSIAAFVIDLLKSFEGCSYVCFKVGPGGCFSVGPGGYFKVGPGGYFKVGPEEGCAV